MIARCSRRIARPGQRLRALPSKSLRLWILLALVWGCVPLEQLPSEAQFPFSISVIAPSEDAFIRPGGTVRIQWIDAGMEPGASIFLKSVSTDESGDQAEVDILARRDATADGDADIFDWNGSDANGNPMPPRSYQIFGVLENPDGRQDVRPLEAAIVIPFDFVGLGSGGKQGLLINNAGDGPFFLQDNDADFVEAGVQTGRTVRIFGGSGSIIGTYPITAVTQTRLTLLTDAGDSGGDNDVRYLAPLDHPKLPDVEALVTIVWQDAEFATSSTITLQVDPDSDPDNDNQFAIREGINLEQDGQRDVFDWDGTDTEGLRVPPGSYYLRAVLNPGSSNELIYLANNRITVGGVEPTLQLTQPASNVSPEAGATVNIAWTDFDPDDDATITLFLDPDTDLEDPAHDDGNEIQIETDLSEDSADDTYAWVTAGTARGHYTVVGRIQDDQGHSAISSAPGRVTLANSPPVLEWVRPEGDSADTDDNNMNGPIRLTDTTADFTADYAGDATVRNLAFEGNSVRILKDTDGVFKGIYPVAEDPVSATEIIMGSNPGDSDGAGDIAYRITGDINLSRGKSPLFDFKTHDPEEAATLDLYLDFDDDRDNGNEIQILEGRAVPLNDEAQDNDFTWTLTRDVDDNTIDPGNYRLFAEMNDGNPENDQTTVEFEGRVFLRTGVDEPTITLTAPSTDTTAAVGRPVAITWEDEDTNDSTTITLRYDDDAVPNEAVETDSAESDLHPGIFIDADLDDGSGLGESDSFSWDWHPSDITKTAVGEGDYYVFAYIGDNGGDPAGDPDMIAVAQGMVSIPNTPVEFEFTNPGTANVEFDSDLVGGTVGTITWNQRDPDPGDTISVDLWLDANDVFDQNQAAENQIVSGDASGGSFDWDGRDRFGTDLETGQYRCLAVVNKNDPDQLITDTPGLVNYRPDTNTAVINMASLFVDVEVTQEGTRDLSWRAVLVTDRERIELFYDDENSTADDLGTLIETGLTHTENIWNIYTWELDTSVPVGDYYIHARLVRAADTNADVSSAPFTLTDGDADFVSDGVQAGDQVRIHGGTGATPGTYTVAGGGVTANALTLTTDPGDSAGDVSYGVGELDLSTSQAIVSVSSGVSPSFDFLQPASPVDVALGGSVDITWEYVSGEAGTLTLKVDPDTTNHNGNEITILDNEPQPAAPGSTTDTLNWDLQDLSATDVPTGEYLVRGILNVPGSNLINDTASGEVKIRKTAAAPLVKLTKPTTITSYAHEADPGASLPIQITWEVDDIPPNGTVKVDLWLDRQQSPEPGTGVLADGADLSALVGAGASSGAIVENIDASQGAYTWTPPGFITNTAGQTYYIHIRIRDGILPADDDRATAVGKINVGS